MDDGFSLFGRWILVVWTLKFGCVDVGFGCMDVGFWLFGR